MGTPGPGRLGDWFNAHAAALVLYARQWVPAGEAEDAVQDAFVSLMGQRRVPANVRAWLFKTVRNGAISATRSRSRRAKREEVAAFAAPGWFDARLEERIDASAAESALRALPPEQREVILLRIWSGLTLAEAAEVTGEPVSTLFDRYRRGLQTLKQNLEALCATKRI